MKKTVPFKKEIVFDNNIDEINSISLEYEVNEKSNNLIKGNFIINGDYRMASGSSNLDTFSYNLPFSINVDSKYNIDEAEIEISDFYYEVVNNKILSVNIELEVDNILENEQNIKLEVDEPVKEAEVIETQSTETIKSLFDNLEDNETYTTYKVHIVTENDTIESIIVDYEITKEKLENYNNLTDIKIGDKIIIPANEN